MDINKQSNELEIIETIGPVFSNWGRYNWDLCLAENKIVARPKGIWLSIKAGIFGGMGAIGLMRETYKRTDENGGRKILIDDDNNKWRIYSTDDLISIMLKRCKFSASEIRIQQKNGKTDVYGIGDYNQIEGCRYILKRLYGNIYKEEGFCK